MHRIEKIRRGWESQQWRSPAVGETTQPDRVKFVLPMVSLIPSESETRLRKLCGPDFDLVSDHVKLGKSEHRRTLSPPSGFIKFTLQAETVYNAGISRTHQVSMLTLLPPTQARNNEAT